MPEQLLTSRNSATALHEDGLVMTMSRACSGWNASPLRINHGHTRCEPDTVWAWWRPRGRDIDRDVRAPSLQRLLRLMMRGRDAVGVAAAGVAVRRLLVRWILLTFSNTPCEPVLRPSP